MAGMRTILVFLLICVAVPASDIESKVKHGYADSNGVKIHYASLGSGPLVEIGRAHV